VDDDLDLLQMYKELLEQLPSRPEIFTATSGPRGLALLKSEPFRLLICDLRMPKMDGLQVLSIVRRSFPELRTVVLTAAHDEEFRTRAYALGVDLYWLKPDTQQNLQQFLQCIESLLGRDLEGGFRGVQSKSLMDIIQMECLSQSSTLLRITRGSLVGRIWIQAGELTDAETEGARGEPAFRRILEWKSGTFETLAPEVGHERTIFKPVNALLLETAQAIDETSAPPPSASADEEEQMVHPKTVWRLAALTREGADFVIGLPRQPGTDPEGWGTEATQELAGWMKVALEACEELSELLDAGPLARIEGRSLDHRLVLLPESEKTFLIGWPADADPNRLADQSKHLVATWDA